MGYDAFAGTYSVQIGSIYKHTHIANLRCKILAETAKGYKVLEMEKTPRGAIKEKTAFFNRQDFNTYGGLWVKIKTKKKGRKPAVKRFKHTPKVVTTKPKVTAKPQVATKPKPKVTTANNSKQLSFF